MATVDPPERIPIRVGAEISGARESVWARDTDEIHEELWALAAGGAELTFTEGDELILRVQAVISGPDEFGTIEIAEGGRMMSWTLDLKRYEETHLAFITGFDDGYSFAGTYDARANRATVNVAVASWLRRDTLERIADSRFRLQDLASEWDDYREPLEGEIAELIAHSRFREHLEAGCWGIAGMMGTLGGDVVSIDIPHHYIEAVKLTIIGVAGYAAARCAKATERRGGTQDTDPA